jgi:CheY-like chemotaxis protein
MARLMFVDDDHYTLETLTRAVQLLGHQAFVAQNGEDAYKMALDQSPDIIFSDMRLPDMLGVDLIEKLRAEEKTAGIPMFILSASPTIDAVERARQVGAQAYIDKPIRLQNLLEIIQAYAPG